jgi:hypothetical protein
MSLLVVISGRIKLFGIKVVKSDNKIEE